jgi:uncharacterized membrane protein
MAAHPEWTRKLFTDDDFEAISRAITDAEATTTAEIRVHLDRRVPHGRFWTKGHPLKRARALFTWLGMHRTRERNGVLIYLAVEDRKLAIVGDDGIHARVGDTYWERVRDVMVEDLRGRSPVDGVVKAVHDLGRVLQQHFPRRGEKPNELSNEVDVE